MVASIAAASEAIGALYAANGTPAGSTPPTKATNSASLTQAAVSSTGNGNALLASNDVNGVSVYDGLTYANSKTDALVPLFQNGQNTIQPYQNQNGQNTTQQQQSTPTPTVTSISNAPPPPASSGGAFNNPLVFLPFLPVLLVPGVSEAEAVVGGAAALEEGLALAEEALPQVAEELNALKAVAASGTSGSANQALIAKLIASETKVTPSSVISIEKLSNGTIAWLEEGNDASGMLHILAEHGPQFIQAGIPESSVPDFLMTALKDGKIVGYQGTGTGRPIYQVLFGGETYNVAITTASNGYIVGANLTGAIP